MPNRYDLKPVILDTVVEPIANPLDVKAPDPGRTCLLNGRTDVRLQEQQVKYVLQFLANSARCSGSVDCPPLYDTFDLACCSARDV